MYTCFEIEFPALVMWAKEELEKGNRVKASKINRIAERLVQLWINRDFDTDEYLWRNK